MPRNQEENHENSTGGGGGEVLREQSVRVTEHTLHETEGENSEGRRVHTGVGREETEKAGNSLLKLSM